jgi:hypothetical protein
VNLEPTSLAFKMIAVHESLAAARISHAFGGALALAWCTQRARGTIDLDVNVFVRPELTSSALAALPPEVVVTDGDRILLERDGQARLWWDGTPVDIFLNTTEFHEQVAARTHLEPFAGQMVPFLSCQDLAVFKAFFNRTKDWADLEAMVAVGSLDVSLVAGVLATYLGSDDDRIDRLLSLDRS